LEKGRVFGVNPRLDRKLGNIFSQTENFSHSAIPLSLLL
jgi:hypothetical protein